MTTKPSIWEAVLRGGQTATHTLEMTRETIQKSLIWTLLPILLVDLFLISRNMPSAAMGALLQKVEAGICQNVGFPLPQKLGITYPDGTVVTLPVKYIAQDPYINFESKIATDQLIRGMWFAIFMTGLAFCGLWFYYKHVGNKKILTRKIRGQKVTTAPLLVEAIEEHNEKAREKRNAQDSKDVKIADVPYPYLTERNHTIVSGTTGMGKTVLISSLIDTIRGRGDKAVILDNEGTYVKRYFNPATDIVLNPLDARTANWDPFLDAQSPEDWSTLAASIFKSPPGDDPYWVESARSIFQWTAITLSMKPETSNVGELLKYLFGETSDLKNLLKGTPAYSHFSSGEGQSNRVDSLKSVIANEVTPLILLTGVEADFSLRDWLVPAEEKAAAKAKEEARAAARANVAIRQNEAVSTESFSSRLVIAIRNFADDFGSAPKLWWDGVRQKSAPEVVQTETPADPVEQGGFLFLTAPEDQLDSLRKLLSFWCELAVITLLSRPEDPDQRCVWLIFDEFPSLPKIEKVAEGPQRLRKHGGCMVLGFQQLSQITERYGPEKARTIMGMCQTQIALGAADPETAEFLSKQFGRVQVRTTEENISYGAHSMRDGVNLVAKEEMQPILLPEDFLNMSMLHGVIRVPNVRSEANGGAFPIAPILIVPKDYEDKGQIRVPTDRNALRQFLATVHAKDGAAEKTPTAEKQVVSDPTADNKPTPKIVSMDTISSSSDSENPKPALRDSVNNASTAETTTPPSDQTADGRATAELKIVAANDADTTAEVERQTDMVAAADDFGTETGEEAAKKRKAAADEANLQMVRDADARQLVAFEANVQRTSSITDPENMLGVQGEGTLEHSTIAEIKYAQLHSADGFRLIAEVALSGLLGGEVNLGKRDGSDVVVDTTTAVSAPSGDPPATSAPLGSNNATGSPEPERTMPSTSPDDFLNPTARDDRDDEHHHRGHTHEQHIARDRQAIEDTSVAAEAAKARSRAIEQQQQDYDRDR